MANEFEENAEICTFHVWSLMEIVLHGYPFRRDNLNPNFKAIMDILGIYIDAEKLENFFHDQECGKGDVWVIGDHKNNCMVFDIKTDSSDPMDVITFGVICKKEHRGRIYDLMYAMKEETQRRLRFGHYDFTEKTGWLSSVLAGEDICTIGSITPKIRYAGSFDDFCKQNNI
ncbi:MAG: hypothetical protein E7494_02720 [Ruminococcus albus]|nr:hypothetical protein [Ruminococcus albus]